MKFEFKISEIANKFFFISNLSKWHFSCRNNYNKEWLKISGKLTKEELRVLDDFRKIIKRYPFKIDLKGETVYLGKCFLLNSEKEAWEVLKKSVKKSEYESLKEIFNIFEKRFYKVWQKNNLNKQVRNFRKFLSCSSSKELFSDLLDLFYPGGKNLVFNVVAISSPLKGEGVTAAGGANLDYKHLTLEIPFLKYGSWEFEHSIGVLAHEVAHILFGISGKRNIERQILVKSRIGNFIKILNRSGREIIEEIIIGAFVPSGYLAEKKLRYKPLNNIYAKNFTTLYKEVIKIEKKELVNPRKFIKYLIWQTYPLAGYYVQEKKEIDKYFINKVIEKLKSVIK